MWREFLHLLFSAKRLTDSPSAAQRLLRLCVSMVNNTTLICVDLGVATLKNAGARRRGDAENLERILALQLNVLD